MRALERLPRVITRTHRVLAAADAVRTGLLTLRQACIVLQVSRAEVVIELDRIDDRHLTGSRDLR